MFTGALRWLALLALLAAAPVLAREVAFGSAHALVIDEATGEVLLEKDADTAAPIASITKLMTAMVVLDAALDADEPIRIDASDMDWLKHTRSGVPAGATLTRGSLLELALIASDNHAAAALARTYPGGPAGFHAAMQAKLGALGLTGMRIDEPTGLSSANQASAYDLAVVLRAAAGYPVIAHITSSRTHATLVNGRRWAVRNTNALVGKPGWDILLSKTGYTNEAGSCVAMRLRAAGRNVIVVLMGAVRAAQRAADATSVLHWLAKSDAAAPQTQAAALPRHVRKPRRARAQAKTPAAEMPRVEAAVTTLSASDGS
jgi:D-alanyl-D-alanine carboxypeptidase/D-alanyl-D-alanine endopeptidase (penicillin-binding protein 7)